MTHLLVDRTPFTEYKVTTNKTRHEGVYTALLASIRFLLHQHQGLVDRDELGKVDRMRLCGAENGFQAGWPASAYTSSSVLARTTPATVTAAIAIAIDDKNDMKWVLTLPVRTRWP